MIKEAIDRILGLAPVEQFQINGRTFTSKQLAEIKPCYAESLQVNTLTGLADYLNENRDNLRMEDLLVHVVDPENVRVLSKLETVHMQREGYINAHHEPASYPFGRYLPVEDFIISLQTFFVPSEMTDRMLRLVGNIAVDASVKHLDDGVSQEITARTGITRLENVQVPNPVDLAPYRTFLEVIQPESKFVFRIKKDKEAAPICALFSADGGNWQLEAVQDIKMWLRQNLPEGITILA